MGIYNITYFLGRVQTLYVKCIVPGQIQVVKSGGQYYWLADSRVNYKQVEPGV